MYSRAYVGVYVGVYVDIDIDDVDDINSGEADGVKCTRVVVMAYVMVYVASPGVRREMFRSQNSLHHANSHGSLHGKSMLLGLDIGTQVVIEVRTLEDNERDVPG